MACCLTAPSFNLERCGLHSDTVSAQASIHQNGFQYYNFNTNITSPRDQRVNLMSSFMGFELYQQPTCYLCYDTPRNPSHRGTGINNLIKYMIPFVEI